MVRGKKVVRLEMRMTEHELALLDTQVLRLQQYMIAMGRDPEKVTRSSAMRKALRLLVEDDGATATFDYETIADIEQSN